MKTDDYNTKLTGERSESGAAKVRPASAGKLIFENIVVINDLVGSKVTAVLPKAVWT